MKSSYEKQKEKAGCLQYKNILYSLEQLMESASLKYRIKLIIIVRQSHMLGKG